MLDELLAKINAMSETDQAALAKQAHAATQHMKFIPNPGPQTEAYLSDADVVLFGGSPGGGKTALEVGLALNEHQRTMIVRKNFVDLEGPLHTLDNILKKPRSATQGNRPKYYGDDGRTIDFVGIGDGLDGKQGNPHDLICVGEGTPVLMANGTYRTVESVREGDMVATLEGPRKVLKSFPTPPKPSVRITLPSGASQVQSATHKLLTTGGWLDNAAYASALPPLIFEPKGCHALCRFFALFGLKYRAVCLSPSPRSASLEPVLASKQVAPRRAEEDSLAYASCKETAVQGNGYAGCGGSIQGTLLQALLSVWKPAQRLLLRLKASAIGTLQHCVYARGGCGVQKTSTLQGWKDRCLDGSHPCGARTLSPSDQGDAPTGGPTYPLQLADVGQQSPTGSPTGGWGAAHTRSHREQWYAHPYTMAPRRSFVAFYESACRVSPVGERKLFDLEIEEVNHFITIGGFVNKNCIDEAAQLPEQQVRMLLGWLRTDKKGQRCRVIFGSNPPLDTTGDWLITYFAPWLNPQHPRPAREGELRYFLPDESGIGDRECEKHETVDIQGVQVPAQSRTFISSKFTDNPYYDHEAYAKSLAGLPDSARAILIGGNFMLTRSDNEFQAIPTEWVRAAQARWTSVPPVGVPMCAIGVDVAQGGNDRTVLAPRYDGWYSELIVKPGKETPDGQTVAGLVVKHRRSEAKPIVDIGGGWGGDAFAALRENGIDAVSYMGVKPSNRRTKDNTLKFFNVRAEAYWRFREALDPSQEQGSTICLPHDPELVADLCALTYEIGTNGIKIESKEKVCDRLKRSTDKGDAVVMAWWSGLKGVNVQDGWKGHRKVPKVVMRR